MLSKAVKVAKSRLVILLMIILQALSVHEHKTPLMTLCVQDDAQQSQGGLTAVSKDVLARVFDVQWWQLTDQLICVCKPLVDIIGDVES